MHMCLRAPRSSGSGVSIDQPRGSALAMLNWSVNSPIGVRCKRCIRCIRCISRV